MATKIAIKKYKVRVTFTEPLLGSQPQKDVASEHIHHKAVKAGKDIADEMEALPEELEKGTTAFHRVAGVPVLWDYQFKGFLKEWGGLLNGHRDVKNLRAKCDNYLYVFPRFIPLEIPEGEEITITTLEPAEKSDEEPEGELPPGVELEHLERPLRANTAQGPRTALARSEMAPVGTSFECEVHSINAVISKPLLTDLLGMGIYKGQGQWRNGSYGRFTFELTELK